MQVKAKKQGDSPSSKAAGKVKIAEASIAGFENVLSRAESALVAPITAPTSGAESLRYTVPNLFDTSGLADNHDPLDSTGSSEPQKRANLQAAKAKRVSNVHRPGFDGKTFVFFGNYSVFPLNLAICHQIPFFTRKSKSGPMWFLTIGPRRTPKWSWGPERASFFKEQARRTARCCTP